MAHQIEFRAMGCQMLAVVDHPAPRVALKLQGVPAWFEEWEQCLSRFRGNSELNFLNNNPGIPIKVSKTLWDVFQAAAEAFDTSQGLVTPAVLDALLSAGYRQSFEQLQQTELSVQPDQLRSIPSLREVKFDPIAHTICLPGDLHLDFGGVAKGWAAHHALQRLQIYGPALVDAGGDIAISGLQKSGSPWLVGIADPFEPDLDLAVLMLGKCGVATSGKDYRRWQQGDLWKHHIIDPRTGLPAETDVLSATIIAPTVLEAEVAAKAVLILGSQSGLAWINARPRLAGLLILESGEHLYSNQFRSYLWREQ